jgi:hypothetical protein
VMVRPVSGDGRRPASTSRWRSEIAAAKRILIGYGGPKMESRIGRTFSCSGTSVSLYLPNPYRLLMKSLIFALCVAGGHIVAAINLALILASVHIRL